MGKKKIISLLGFVLLLALPSLFYLRSHSTDAPPTQKPVAEVSLEEASSKQSIRFIPVGWHHFPRELNAPEQEEEFDHLKSPSHLLPPTMISIGAERPESPEKLQLGKITGIFKIPFSQQKISLFDLGQGKPLKWLETELPTSSVNLGILYQDPGKRDWKNPRILILPDDETVFPANHIRIVNVSKKEILVRMTNQPSGRFGILPGHAATKKLSREISFISLDYLSEDKMRQPFYKNRPKMKNGTRLQCFIYDIPNRTSSAVGNQWILESPPAN